MYLLRRILRGSKAELRLETVGRSMMLLLLGVAAFSVSYIAVASIRRVAIRRNLLDVPNERSSHRLPTPRGGGLAIAGVVLIGFGLSRLVIADLGARSMWGYLVGAAIIVTASGADDLWTLSASLRLKIQLIAAVAFVTLAGSFDRIELPVAGTLNCGWLGIPITVFWILGLTNAYNFMDGIDGIAAGQAIVAGGMWTLAATSLGLSALSVLSVLVVGASFGFLLHNMPPARIFMGDVGSTLLGYTFAVLPVLALQQTDNPRFAIAGVLSVGPFVLDTTLTIIRRAFNRENLLQAHRSHLYQRLVRRGYSHGFVSSMYTTLAALSAVLGLMYLKN